MPTCVLAAGNASRAARAGQELRFRSESAVAIREQFPGCPVHPRRGDRASCEAARGSGRVGRSAAGQALDRATLYASPSLPASCHVETDDDALLMSGVDRESARAQVQLNVSRTSSMRGVMVLRCSTVSRHTESSDDGHPDLFAAHRRQGRPATGYGTGSQLGMSPSPCSRSSGAVHVLERFQLTEVLKIAGSRCRRDAADAEDNCRRCDGGFPRANS